MLLTLLNRLKKHWKLKILKNIFRKHKGVTDFSTKCDVIFIIKNVLIYVPSKTHIPSCSHTLCKQNCKQLSSIIIRILLNNYKHLEADLEVYTEENSYICAIIKFFS